MLFNKPLLCHLQQTAMHFLIKGEGETEANLKTHTDAFFYFKNRDKYKNILKKKTLFLIFVR